MPILLAIVVLLALGFLTMWILANRSATTYRAQSEAQARELTGERDQLAIERDRLTTERNQLTADRDRLTGLNETQAGEIEQGKARITKLESQSTQLSGVVRRLTGEIDQLKSTSAEQASQLESQAKEIAGLLSENNALEARAETAEAEVAAAEARNAGVVIGDVVDAESGQPATLWSLELARSERTWRTSVAANPYASPTPLETTDDPVRTAVEIEASALRENVGAFISIDWQAGPVPDPSRAHLIVRIAQELLEAAARNPEPLRLVVTGDDEVTLRLEPLEPSGKPINLIPPVIANEGVRVDDSDGLNVTVRAT